MHLKKLKALGVALGLVMVAGLASAETYKVDPATSQLKWLAKKVTGQHNGTVDIKSGELKVEKGMLTGGKVDVDMNSIKVLDLTDADSNAKLTGHLKSNDFFAVEKNPTSTFEIKTVKAISGAKAGEANATIDGVLTIKGIAKPLSFPAIVAITKNSVSASAVGVKVDRTAYDIRYGSGKFFQGLGDKVIYDEFTLDITLNAKK
jgi:polyisoprenoid-binding protein YceI